MTHKKVQQVTNPSKLTATEASEARRLRALVEQDKDEIIAEGGRFLAERDCAWPGTKVSRRSGT